MQNAVDCGWNVTHQWTLSRTAEDFLCLAPVKLFIFAKGDPFCILAGRTFSSAPQSTLSVDHTCLAVRHRLRSLQAGSLDPAGGGTDGKMIEGTLLLNLAPTVHGKGFGLNPMKPNTFIVTITAQKSKTVHLLAFYFSCFGQVFEMDNNPECWYCPDKSF